MPARVGPAARALCTLSPWPLQAHLSPTPGASTGLPCRHLVCLFGQTTWQFWLQLNGPAAGSNPSRRRPRPRAESRWGQGCHAPPPLPLLYPCKWATSMGFKCGGHKSPLGGCAQRGLLELGCGVLGSWLVLTPPPLTYKPGKARNPGFISVPFSRCTGNRLLLGEGWECRRR